MDIKKRIRGSGCFQWEVAEKIGVGEATLCRWLRRPEKLETAKVKKIEAAIEKLQAEKAKEASGNEG